MAENPQGKSEGRETFSRHPDAPPQSSDKESAPVGGLILADGEIEINAGRPTVTVKVRNTGDRPIQVGSHFHFFEVNRYLEFDRPAAFGMRLNIPSDDGHPLRAGRREGRDARADGRKAVLPRLQQPGRRLDGRRPDPRLPAQLRRGREAGPGTRIQVVEITPTSGA